MTRFSLISFGAVALIAAGLFGCGSPPVGGGENSTDNNDANDSFNVGPGGNGDTTESEARVEGFVIDEEGEPMESAPVVVFREEGPSEIGVMNTTHEDGYFLVGGLSVSDYEIFVMDEFEEVYGPDIIELSQGTKEVVFDSLYDGDTDPTASLEPTPEHQLGTFEGRLVDENGDAVDAGAVALMDDSQSQMPNGFPIAAAIFDDDGSFSIPAVAPGQYTPLVEVDGGEFEAEPVELNAGQTTFEILTVPDDLDGGPPPPPDLNDDENQNDGTEPVCPGDEELVEIDGEQFCARPCTDDADCDDEMFCEADYCLAEDL